MQPASVAVATDLSAHSQGTPHLHPNDCACGPCSLNAVCNLARSMQRAVDADCDRIFRLAEPHIGRDTASRRTIVPPPSDKSRRRHLATRAIDRLCGAEPEARRKLEEALELSRGYLRKVRQGKTQPSASLTLLLTMLADDGHPIDTIRALWTSPTTPTKRRRR